MECRQRTLESLGMNPAFWKNKKVLLTGHTGFKGSWLSLWLQDEPNQPHETTYLKLDSSKAQSALSWSPVLDLTTALDWIIEWYQRVFSANEARKVTLEQIHRFQHQAAQ